MATPKSKNRFSGTPEGVAKVVGLGRVELPTSPLSGVRSNQLSYRPNVGRLPRRVQARRLLDPHSKQKGFEDKVEHAGHLRCPRPSCDINQAKKACIRIPALTVRDGNCRLDGHPHPTSLDAPRSRKGYECHRFSFRKEVIQPQVLLRLPCYDFTPIMSHTLGRCLPFGLACRLLVQPTFVM